MDAKRLKKNYSTFSKLIDNASGGDSTSNAISDEGSKLNLWLQQNEYKAGRINDPENFVFEAFSQLLYCNITKVTQGRDKLITYIEANATKFDSYLKKNTEFDDIGIYVDQLKTKQVDWMLDTICLLGAYNRNMKVLYYNGDSLKEKVITLNPKNGNDGSSAGVSTLDNEEYLMVFLTQDKLIPLLVDENDSDLSSEKSIELVIGNTLQPIAKKITTSVSDRGNKDNIYDNMSKYVDEEFETKLNIEHDDDETPFFSEIWERPNETNEDQDLLLDPVDNIETTMNVTVNAPPGFENKIGAPNMSPKNIKRK